MNPNLFTYDQFENAFRKKGYKFDYNSFELNLVGIRSTIFPEPNKFDDIFAIVYKDIFGFKNSYCVNCTTDPGFYWLEFPINIKGTAILKEGQYDDVWSFGSHSGYEALVQTGLFTVYRDNNKDQIMELDPNNLDVGYFGIDMHHALDTGTTENVNKWGGGCQVIANIVDYYNILNLCKLQKKKTFAYTLFDEKDFIG